MDEKRLAEIKERTEKATAGPWEWDDDLDLRCSNISQYVFYSINAENIGITQEDAEFIANARQDIPDLIAEIERLRKALEDCEHYSESPRMISEVVWEALNWQS